MYPSTAKDLLNAEKATQFLARIPIPEISHSQQKSLNVPITITEIPQTISHLPNSKLPGPDGYTSEFFKLLKDDLTGPLNNPYNSIENGSPYFPTGKDAHIKVLTKKVKDPLEPTSNRPISLINVDAKILLKIIANRLASIMPSIIITSQLSFVKGRSGQYQKIANIKKVLSALEHSKR